MEKMIYTSTRDNSINVSASEAILQGLSKEGGLFVPAFIPKLDKSIEELATMDYKQIAYEVMKLYFDDFTKEELEGCIADAYDSKFDTDEIAPISYVDGAYYLELYHGATIAFKDMALSILPHLMTTAAKKKNISNEIVILTATSGDTGKAALSGFADVSGTKIIVFYPKGGVSYIQERQMVTQAGENTCVIGINGNFDDAQTGVKKIFGDKDLEEYLDGKGYQFSSANSINIGRLFPQVAYYVYVYAKLLGEGKIISGQKINVVVPTGNFGNILAAYYAKNMGIPIDKLVCASNENTVLYDFFKTGKYDRNRHFMLTNSPSMDILISSNLERLIYMIAGCDATKNNRLMQQLSTIGEYAIDEDMKASLNDFIGGYADQQQTKSCIKDIYNKTGYVLDTHTAVASYVYSKYVEESKDDTTTVVVSTASPYKFTASVMEAIEGKELNLPDFEQVDMLSKMSKMPVPRAIEEIRTAPIRHNRVVEIEQMKDAILTFLGC